MAEYTSDYREKQELVIADSAVIKFGWNDRIFSITIDGNPRLFDMWVENHRNLVLKVKDSGSLANLTTNTPDYLDITSTDDSTNIDYIGGGLKASDFTTNTPDDLHISETTDGKIQIDFAGSITTNTPQLLDITKTNGVYTIDYVGVVPRNIITETPDDISIRNTSTNIIVDFTGEYVKTVSSGDSRVVVTQSNGVAEISLNGVANASDVKNISTQTPESIDIVDVGQTRNINYIGPAGDVDGISEVTTNSPSFLSVTSSGTVRELTLLLGNIFNQITSSGFFTTVTVSGNAIIIATDVKIQNTDGFIDVEQNGNTFTLSLNGNTKRILTDTPSQLAITDTNNTATISFIGDTGIANAVNTDGYLVITKSGDTVTVNLSDDAKKALAQTRKPVVMFGKCDTVATVALKAVTVQFTTASGLEVPSTFEFGDTLNVVFSSGNTTTSTPILSINNGAGINVSGFGGLYISQQESWYADDMVTFVFNGANWEIKRRTRDIFLGSVTSVQGATAKVATCAGFVSNNLVNGTQIFVSFSNGSTVTTSFTLNINSTGTKNVGGNGGSIPTFIAGQIGHFVYWGGAWVCMGGGSSSLPASNNKPFSGWCSSEATASAKIVSCDEFTADNITEGTFISVTYVNGNTSTSGSNTLNINGTGPTSTRVGTTSGYNMTAAPGETVLYSCVAGSYWHPVKLLKDSAFGTCTTAAGTVQKVINTTDLMEFNLVPGTRMSVQFTNSCTAEGATLRLGTSTNIHPVMVNNETITYGAWRDGELIDFVFNGTHWQMYRDNVSSFYATCPTSAGTSRKSIAGTTGMWHRSIGKGSILAVLFDNANTASTVELATTASDGLDVSWPVIMNKSSSGLSGAWSAGELVWFIFDGTNFRMGKPS